METNVKNVDIASLTNNWNFLINQFQESESAQTLEFTKSAIEEALALLSDQSVLTKVLGEQNVKIRNYHPTDQVIPEAPAPKDLKNRALSSLNNMARALRIELIRGDSSARSNGLSVGVMKAQQDGIDKLRSIIKDWAEADPGMYADNVETAVGGNS